MSEKPLHNFEFPNDLKWNTERVYNRRRTQTTSPSPIFHSSDIEPVSERAHVPFKLSTVEEDALEGLECPLIEYYNKNVVSIGKVDVEIVEKKGDVEGADVAMKQRKGKDNVHSEERSDVVKKMTKKEVNVGGGKEDEVKKHKRLIKIPCKNKHYNLEADMIYCKEKNVESNFQEPIIIEGKGKDVMTSEGEKNNVESNGKEAIIKKDAEGKVIELVEEKKREVMKMEKNVERKEEKGTDFIDGIDEARVKSWNLRSRTNKSLDGDISGNGSTFTKAEKGKTQLPTSNAREIWEKKASGSGAGGEKVKLTVNVALTESEIKEDFYALGYKLSRRVKKRPKHVQNIIDGLCPGNNLVNISEDTYYVSANSMKKQG